VYEGWLWRAAHGGKARSPAVQGGDSEGRIVPGSSGEAAVGAGVAPQGPAPIPENAAVPASPVASGLVTDRQAGPRKARWSLRRAISLRLAHRPVRPRGRRMAGGDFRRGWTRGAVKIFSRSSRRRSFCRASWSVSPVWSASPGETISTAGPDGDRRPHPPDGELRVFVAAGFKLLFAHVREAFFARRSISGTFDRCTRRRFSAGEVLGQRPACQITAGLPGGRRSGGTGDSFLSLAGAFERDLALAAGSPAWTADNDGPGIGESSAGAASEGSSRPPLRTWSARRAALGETETRSSLGRASKRKLPGPGSSEKNSIRRTGRARQSTESGLPPRDVAARCALPSILTQAQRSDTLQKNAVGFA
jgi:hypothetical protein